MLQIPDLYVTASHKWYRTFKMYFVGKGYRRLYECVGIPSNTLQKEDFQRIYVQLQEIDAEGQTKYQTAYQVLLKIVGDNNLCSKV